VALVKSSDKVIYYRIASMKSVDASLAVLEWIVEAILRKLT